MGILLPNLSARRLRARFPDSRLYQSHARV
jgi:hypothetical protein